MDLLARASQSGYGDCSSDELPLRQNSGLDRLQALRFRLNAETRQRLLEVLALRYSQLFLITRS